MPTVLLSLSLSVAPVVLASTAAPADAMVRAADDDRPHRRSRDREHAQPRVQMGAGPTALAMLAFVAAVVARAVRRRRAAAVLD